MSSYVRSDKSNFNTYVYVDGSRRSADASGLAKYSSVAGSVILPLQAGQQVTLRVSGEDTYNVAGYHMFSGFRIFPA